MKLSENDKKRLELEITALYVCKHNTSFKIFCYPKLYTLVEGDEEVYSILGENGLAKCKAQARKRIMPLPHQYLTWEKIQ